jgi:hypothetical protein
LDWRGPESESFSDVSLTQSEWRSGSCQLEEYTHDLKSQTGPTCPELQALTDWKETHNGCQAGQINWPSHVLAQQLVEEGLVPLASTASMSSPAAFIPKKTIGCMEQSPEEIIKTRAITKIQVREV